MITWLHWLWLLVFVGAYAYIIIKDGWRVALGVFLVATLFVSTFLAIAVLLS